MSHQQLDAQGEAHEALGSAVTSYGQRVLSDPRTLANLVADLLPDLPRERNLLVAGAEAGIAAEMTQHVEQQHIDADTAVQLAARTLSDGRAIDPAASLWVAQEYAQALGYQVRPYVPPPPPEPTGGDNKGGRSWIPTTTWPPRNKSDGGYQTAQNRGRRGGVIAAAAVAGAVVLYLIVAALAHTVPFAKSHPVAVTKPTHKPTLKPTLKTSTSPAPSLAAGVTPLLQLLPQDIDDPATQCQAEKKPEWAMPGLVSALDCTDPDLPNGGVNGYQMDSRADFETAWRNFNQWWTFDSSSAKANCPPSGSAQGQTPWYSGPFPKSQGQVLECQIVSGNAPAYVWSLPKHDMFFFAFGGDNTSFKALDTWWKSSESNPAVSPTTTPSSSAS